MKTIHTKHKDTRSRHRLPPKKRQSVTCVIESPQAHDVLLGRGLGIAMHSGNALFRKLVDERRRQYQAARREDKALISRSIVQIIQDKGGRFLSPCNDETQNKLKMMKKNNHNNNHIKNKFMYLNWQQVSMEKAMNKTSQALREQHVSAVRTQRIRKGLQSNQQTAKEIIINNKKNIKKTKKKKTTKTKTKTVNFTIRLKVPKHILMQAQQTTQAAVQTVAVPPPRHSRVTRAALRARQTTFHTTWSPQQQQQQHHRAPQAQVCTNITPVSAAFRPAQFARSMQKPTPPMTVPASYSNGGTGMMASASSYRTPSVVNQATYQGRSHRQQQPMVTPNFGASTPIACDMLSQRTMPPPPTSSNRNSSSPSSDEESIGVASGCMFCSLHGAVGSQCQCAAALLSSRNILSLSAPSSPWSPLVQASTTGASVGGPTVLEDTLRASPSPMQMFASVFPQESPPKIINQGRALQQGSPNLLIQPVPWPPRRFAASPSNYQTPEASSRTSPNSATLATGLQQARTFSSPTAMTGELQHSSHGRTAAILETNEIARQILRLGSPQQPSSNRDRPTPRRVSDVGRVQFETSPSTTSNVDPAVMSMAVGSAGKDAILPSPNSRLVSDASHVAYPGAPVQSSSSSSSSSPTAKTAIPCNLFGRRHQE